MPVIYQKFCIRADEAVWAEKARKAMAVSPVSEASWLSLKSLVHDFTPDEKTLWQPGTVYVTGIPRGTFVKIFLIMV